MSRLHCGKWMPVAKTRCARTQGHKGDCMTVEYMERQRRYDAGRREERLRYYADHREEVRERNRRWRAEHPAEAFDNSQRSHARARARKFAAQYPASADAIYAATEEAIS